MKPTINGFGENNLIEPLLGLKYNKDEWWNELRKKLNRTTFGIEIHLSRRLSNILLRT